MQFCKPGIESRARAGVKTLQLLNALKNLGGHAGAERPDAIKPEGVVTAKRILKLGHGFLELAPGREKELEGMVTQGKKMLGVAGVRPV